MQVADALRPLGEALGLKLCCVFGGAPYGKQIDALNRGVDLVVATPGRLIDLLERRCLVLSGVEVSVIDEADHMADLGFLPAVTTILDQTAPDGQRMLFSATLDRGVDKLVRAYLKDPALHAVATSSSHIDAMEHRVFTLRSEDKVAVITELAARPGSHVDLRADQARCRPARDAAGPRWRARRGDSRQLEAERSPARSRRIRRRPPEGARRDRCRSARHSR